MQSLAEQVSPSIGNSFRIERFEATKECALDFWHHHPEYEIVYVHRSKGELCIGNYLSHYQAGTLLFIGPNIPHQPFMNKSDLENYEIIVLLREDFMGKEFLTQTEMTPLRRLFERAQQGLIFGPETHKLAGKKLDHMLNQAPFKRFILLLDLLNDLSLAEDYQIMNSHAASLAIKSGDFNRMKAVYSMVADQYAEDIKLETAASLANLTVPAFCRLFKKLTGKTFTRFLNEYRISKALHLLNTIDCPIADVAYQTGFKSVSYFNRQFKTVTGHQPTHYKRAYSHLITDS